MDVKWLEYAVFPVEVYDPDNVFTLALSVITFARIKSMLVAYAVLRILALCPQATKCISRVLAQLAAGERFLTRNRSSRSTLPRQLRHHLFHIASIKRHMPMEKSMPRGADPIVRLSHMIAPAPCNVSVISDCLYLRMIEPSISMPTPSRLKMRSRSA